jgi:hypothetical protein
VGGKNDGSAEMKAAIEIAAQFGGRDAAQVAMPHFKALKAAARGGGVRNFPVPELAFLLRVDGEVNEYGLSGAGNLDVDAQGEYISVDIGCAREDRTGLEERIASAIVQTVELLRAFGKPALGRADFALLAEDLDGFVERYRAKLPR